MAALKPAKAPLAAREPAATKREDPDPNQGSEGRTTGTTASPITEPSLAKPVALPPQEPLAVAPVGQRAVSKPDRTDVPLAAATSAAAPASSIVPRANAPAKPGRTEHLPDPSGPALDPAVLGLFSHIDPLRANVEIFQRLANRFDVAVQDVRLSLPFVFTDRRFEILSFGGQEIGSVLELRSEEFYGFYLSHISERRIDFVYAHRGTHIEWGPDKCVLQPSAHAEAMEFAGSALRALAQEARAEFLAVNDLAANPESQTQDWVWQGWVR
jgi:hypothetical protein